MDRIPTRSVHLVVTSPPYWQLKDYGAPGQVGFHQSYKEYLVELGRVWRQCARVLHSGCRVVVNIGDQFARAEAYGRYRVIPIHAEIIRQFERLALDFMGSIIWQKVTTCNTSGGGVVMGSFPHPRNGIVKLDYEHILVFKKPGTPPHVDPEKKRQARLTTKEWNEYFYGHWYFPGTRQKDHIATFPDELPRRLIRMFTFPGEIVLDPFLGSGTTMKVAREQGRSSIGYEINPDFEEVIKEKAGFGRTRDILLQKGTLEVVREKIAESTDESKSEEQTERIAPPGGYGSVIRKGDSRYREKYHRVSAVVSACTVELDGDRTVGLLGLKENDRSPSEGTNYLRGLVKGQRVYCRTDPQAGRQDRVYLHLQNRTCINSRLLRAGLVDVDPGEDFRNKKRYIRYQNERGDC